MAGTGKSLRPHSRAWPVFMVVAVSFLLLFSAAKGSGQDNLLLNLVYFYIQKGQLADAKATLTEMIQTGTDAEKASRLLEMLETTDDPTKLIPTGPERGVPSGTEKGWNRNVTRAGLTERKDGGRASMTPEARKAPPEKELPPDKELALEIRVKDRMRYAEELIARKDFQMAEKKLEEVLELRPAETKALFMLGRLAFLARNWKQAVLRFEQGLATGVEDAAARYYLGMAKKALGDSAGARREIERSFELEPRDARTGLELANMQRFSGEFGKAIETYKKVLSYHPDLLLAHLGIADAFFAAGDIKQATSAYAYVLKKNPREAVAYVGLARIFAASSQDAEALKLVEKALEYDRNNSQAAELKGVLLYRIGKFADAEQALLKAVSLDPKNRSALLNLINFLLDRKNMTKLEEVLGRAIRYQPDLYEVNYLLGIIYSNRKEFEKAEPLLRKAMELRTGDIDSTLALAILMMNTGRLLESAGLYRQALAIARKTDETSRIELIEMKLAEIEKRLGKSEAGRSDPQQKGE